MAKKNKERCECNKFDKMEALFMILSFSPNITFKNVGFFKDFTLVVFKSAFNFACSSKVIIILLKLLFMI